MSLLTPPLSLEIRFRRLEGVELARLVLATEWAKTHHYSISGVIWKIRTQKLRGFKISGRWYVDPGTS